MHNTFNPDVDEKVVVTATRRIGLAESGVTYPHTAKGIEHVMKINKRRKQNIVVTEKDSGETVRSFNPKSFKTPAALIKALTKLIRE